VDKPKSARSPFEKLNEVIEGKNDVNYPYFDRKKNGLKILVSTNFGVTNFGFVSKGRYQPLWLRPLEIAAA
jgi:hypothetical protein